MSACPRKVRGDRGTENKDIADMQSVLTPYGTFVYGASTGNQRIEAFWRHLRMECCQFWIEFFGHLRDIGEFSGDIIDKNLVQFVFMNFVQNDINKAVSVWNTHRIRPTKNGNVPAGKPCILYCLPELNGTKDYSVEFDQHVLQICRNQCLFNRNTPNDSDMHALINLLMEENGLILPESVEEAYDLYVTQEIHIL
uniref:Integrase core domain-containing protein n=1 Tax=Magallana gigas TaxID=29159 RepID=A0A8W8I469_MAGGI